MKSSEKRSLLAAKSRSGPSSHLNVADSTERSCCGLEESKTGTSSTRYSRASSNSPPVANSKLSLLPGPTYLGLVYPQGTREALRLF